MCIEMLSALHWLVGIGTIAGLIQRLVGVSIQSYAPTNTMESLDLRGSRHPSYEIADFDSAFRCL